MLWQSAAAWRRLAPWVPLGRRGARRVEDRRGNAGIMPVQKTGAGGGRARPPLAPGRRSTTAPPGEPAGGRCTPVPAPRSASGANRGPARTRSGAESHDGTLARAGGPARTRSGAHAGAGRPHSAAGPSCRPGNARAGPGDPLAPPATPRAGHKAPGRPLRGAAAPAPARSAPGAPGARP